MMSLILLLYFLAAALICIGHFQSQRSRWLAVLFTGFIVANIGLAFYTEILSFANNMDNPLFGEISSLIWKANYFLKLDIYGIYRLMNVGTGLYALGSLSFALSGRPPGSPRWVKKLRLPALGLFLILFDPAFMSQILSGTIQAGGAAFGAHPEISRPILLTAWNLTGNILLKVVVALSVIVMIRSWRTAPSMHKPGSFFSLISIVPFHIFFLILFYWFPDHDILYRRYSLLNSVSLTFSRPFAVVLMTVMAVAVLLLFYAVYRYNILRISVRRNRLRFQDKVKTAGSGLRIFSHSMKNQFVAIRLLCSAMEERGGPEAQRILGICNSAIDRLDHLSRGFKPQTLVFKAIEPAEFIEKIFNRHASDIKDLEIRPHPPGPLILADPSHLEEVVINIITNSIEAQGGPENLRLRVETRFESAFGVIEISDNGPGIPPAAMKKAAEPFYSTKPTVSNWGLGLSYCQSVMEAFGGFMEMENRSSGGLLTRLSIPRTGPDT